MAYNIKVRNGTSTQFTSANPTLLKGEIGICTDTDCCKLGDGTTQWNDLDYYFPGIPSFAIADLPSAVTTKRYIVFVSDDIGGAVPAFNDGTNWRRVTDRTIVSTT